MTTAVHRHRAGRSASPTFTEIRREPGDRPGWPGTVWLEHRSGTGRT